MPFAFTLFSISVVAGDQRPPLDFELAAERPSKTWRRFQVHDHHLARTESIAQQRN